MAELNTALDALTDKQRAFVLHYLRHFNAAKAARDAGYSEHSDADIGWENLRKPDVAAAIAEQLDRLGLTPERLKCELAEIAFDGDIAAFDQWVHGEKSLDELQAAGFNTKLVKSLSETDKGRRVEVYSRVDAIKELVRVLGLITEHKRVEVSGGLDYSNMTTEQIKRVIHATRDEALSDDKGPASDDNAEGVPQ